MLSLHVSKRKRKKGKKMFNELARGQSNFKEKQKQKKKIYLSALVQFLLTPNRIRKWKYL